MSLTVKDAGFYKLTLDDGNDRTLLNWSSALPMTLKSAAGDSMNDTYADMWLLYFYVPKGTKTIGLFGGNSGEVRNSAERTVFWRNGRAPNYYSFAVPGGEDGKLWSLKHGRGAVRLLTVPPRFAHSAAELLLYAEVIANDAAKE
ncbi:MAG TPA: hypothetical protein VKX17_13490 [Planctomycetota bacterium]|nr:hypothetical protein [Planctomycetota bacterium]